MNRFTLQGFNIYIINIYFIIFIFFLCYYFYLYLFYNIYIYIYILKNHLYKNVQTEINQILRYLEHTQGVSQSRTTLFFPLIIFVCEKYK